MSGRVLAVIGLHGRDHRNPPGHPESVERLDAVARAILRVDDVDTISGRMAEVADVELVHSRDHVEAIRALADSGGAEIDPDTFVSEGTFRAALGAAGAGLTALEQLAGGSGHAAAFVVPRPPGHHASATRSMGSCIFNNVAIAAARLAADGERVVIVDWDVHHGNGTQEIFWSDDRVLYVSLHQEVTFPGTGGPHERGPLEAGLTTVNLPLPAGATGDVYLRVLDDIVAPVVARFAPDWVLVSCGFDAHRDDPLARMNLTADDFALLATRVAAMAPAPGRTVLFLEGGYDLDALEASTVAVLTALTAGTADQVAPSSGGPGGGRIGEFARVWLPDDDHA